jgi:hypothetical protein
VSSPRWGQYKDEETLKRILEHLARADIANLDWTYIRQLLLAAWPTRQDIGDQVQEVGTLHEGPKEADVDVPEV